jgi:photosystem II stability/assembly factor-like uncharacterized protein
MKARRLALLLCIATGGCAAVDPCSGTSGVCLGLDLQGNVGDLDAVQTDFSGALARQYQLPFNRKVSLPVAVGLRLPDATNGELTVSVVALLDGKAVGVGTGTINVVAGARSRLVVHLSKVTGASCTDGYWDGDETDVDCGGSCPACALGKTCQGPSDCVSQICVQKRCTAVDPDRSTVTVNPATVVADDVQEATVTVTLLDAAGNPIPDLDVFLRADGDSTANLQQLNATDAQGTTQGTLTSPVEDLVTFTATAGGVMLSAHPTVTFTVGPPSMLVFSVPPTSTTAGATIAPAVQVTVEDAEGRTVPTNTGVTMAIGANPGSATLSGTATVDAVDGVATFSDLSIGKFGSGYTLVASAAGLQGAESAPFNVPSGVASAATSTVTVTPSTGVVADGATAATVTVTLRDAHGNPVAGDGVLLELSGSGNTIAQPAATGTDGTTTGTVTSTVAEQKTVTVLVGSLTLTAQPTVTFTAGAAAALAFTVQPTSSVSGSAIAPAVAVVVLDAKANRVTTSTAAVTVAIGANPNGGTLSGTKTVNATAGIATFSDLNIDKAGTGYTLTASSGGLASATSGSFNIAVGAPAKLAFTQQPRPVAAGTTMLPVRVALEDAAGNTIPSATGSVTLAFGTGAGPAILSGATASAAGGVATFNSISVDTAGSYTLVASSSGYASATSASFVVTAFPWMPARAGLAPGVLYALAIDPKTPSTIYIGTPEGGGVFKTTNGGTLWSAMNNGLTDLNVYSLAIDPSTTSNVYVGTVASGVFKSTDGGNNWSPINTGLPPNYYVPTLAIDPVTPTTVYAGGVYKTVNGGSSWSAANTGLTTPNVTRLVVDSTSAVYAATQGAGIFKTTTGGSSWSPINTGIGYLYFSALAVDPTTPANVYAFSDSIYKTITGGTSWSATSWSASQVYYLAVDPMTPANVYAGTVYYGMYMSSDGGTSWKPINSGFPAPPPVVYAGGIDPVTPANQYIATNSGVWKTTNGGTSWSSALAGITNSNVHALAVDPTTTPSTVYAAASMGVFKTTDGGASWTLVSGGSNGISPLATFLSVAIDPVTPATLYAGLQGGAYKTTNGGTFWTSMGDLATVFVNAFAVDPTTPTTVYAATNSGIYKTTNGGTTWMAMNTMLTNTNVYALAMNLATPATLYAATWNGGVFKSTDGAMTWTAMNNGITNLYVGALAIDPTTPTTVYAGTTSQAFKSIDGGGTWSPLPGFGRIDSLVIDKTTPTNVYAATYGSGVLTSTDGGTSWYPASSGLTNSFVQTLAIDPNMPTTLYAGTFGSGVFKTLTSAH